MSSALDDLPIIPDELLARATPDELEAIEAMYEQAFAVAAREDENNWEHWLPWLFPTYFTAPFAPHHRDLWRWIWLIENGVKPDDAFVAIWPRGGAKSSSAEAAVVALAARGRRKYGLYICHAKGTMICAEHGWQPVEEHPTAQPILVDRTLRVRLAGLPFDEVVSPEHRYWARRVARRDHGNGTAPEIRRTRPNWIEADDLDWNTWLGLPIDPITNDAPPMLTVWNPPTSTYEDVPCPWADDPEFWWAIGLWWGDGTLGGGRGQQISWSMGDAHPDLVDRLVAALESFGFTPRLNHHKIDAVANVSICHASLSRWLKTWKVGGNSRKTPPAFIEQLPHDKQAALLRGYFDADGYLDEHAASISSVHLDGLLAARRILARLGIPSAITQIRPAGASSILGREIMRQAVYRLSFRDGVERLGLEAIARTNIVRDQWIADGCLWSRVRDVAENGVQMIVPIQTVTHDYVTAFARSHNCETQPQADDHVGNIGSMLESSRLGVAYPELGERLVGKFGSSKGWRRNRLRTKGFTIDALGLDVAARGMRLDEDRPDLLIFDDVDSDSDGPGQVQKKIDAITKKLLPAGSEDLAILAIQNLVHPQGVFARLAGVAEVPADFLTNRIVSGPIPALEDATFDVREDGSWHIVAGTPTWEGQDLERCQENIDDWGITAFKTEAQHDTDALGGGIFDHVIFQHCERHEVPALVRTEVWVDPAVTNTDKSDSQAIQCDGIGVDGVLYRLRSWEHRASPVDALGLAIAWGLLEGAMRVGVETDQGGDTWRSVYKEALEQVKADIATVQAGDPISAARRPEYLEAIIELSYRATEEGREIWGVVSDPFFAWEKAGSTQMPKAHRVQQMLPSYEKARRIVHVLGTHRILERALFRFPRTKPFDLADAAYWSWHALDLYGKPAKTSTKAAARKMPVAAFSNTPRRPVSIR